MPGKKERQPTRELFAMPEDLINAHLIVQEELGEGVRANYMGMPKNVGAMGDDRVYAHTVVVSAADPEKLRAIAKNPDLLTRTATRLCNETGATCRVLLDITPDEGYFETDWYNS